ncbi:MAG: hypothetical protein U9Q72_00225 [Patescibacteria group bacterium]|nr:hypothetical protein [Patescibacteria group bacterium]
MRKTKTSGKTKSNQEILADKALVLKKEAKKNIAKAKKSLKLAEDKVETYMKDNPVKAATIAAGIGAVVGAGVAALIKGRKK